MEVIAFVNLYFVRSLFFRNFAVITIGKNFSMYNKIPKVPLFIFTLFFFISAHSEIETFTKKQNSKVHVGNPIFEGWYADPEGVVFDNTYWIFPTYSAPFSKQLFMDCFSSEDLLNWKQHKRILSTDGVSWIKNALWAPSIIKKGNLYYLFFSANNIQNNDQYGGIGVATSTRPDGPYKDAIGKPLIDKIINGAQPIDQFVFLDDDGQYYMYYGGWGHCNLVRLNQNLTGIIPFDDGTYFKEITPENYVEGPFMLKHNNKYYFMWSEGNWTGDDYCVAYAISDSPTGPFKRENVILKQNKKIGTGAGHHSVFKVNNNKNNKKEDYYIVYHRHPLNNKDGNAREICIDRLSFSKTGHILPVKMTTKGVKKRKLLSK